MILNLLFVAGTVISVIVGVVAVGIVVSAIALHYVRKKQGKTGCGCDCAGCSACCACRPKEKKEQKRPEK